jgi:hypothetical protein
MRRIIPTLAVVSISLGALALAPDSGGAQGRSRNSDEPFRWSGEIQKGHWVYVHNVNGLVRVEAGSGTKVEITATKHWRRGDPDEVKISLQQVGSGRGDVLVCALWNENSTCDEDGVRSHNDGWRNHNNDTSVEFIVRLPAGVNVNATTVNGGVEVDGATAVVIAKTVNGNVEARSTGGPVHVRTVNGDIDVRAGTIGDERLDYSTTNGSITLEIPASANADVDMRTVNGGLSSDFPLMVQGRFDRRHMQATLGKGGPVLRLSTVNGSIRLRKA